MVDHLTAPVLLLETVHVVGVDPVREEQRDRDDRRDVPQSAIDHGDQRRGDAGSQQVHGSSRQRALRPRPQDGTPRDERHDDVRQHALREVIRDDCGGDGKREPRPQKHAGHHAGDRLMRDVRCLRGSDHDGGVDQRLDERRSARQKRRRQRGGRGHDHRHVAAEEHERREDDHERGRHDRPVRRRALLDPEARDHHRGQHESRQVRQAVGRHPAHEARNQDRAGQDGRERRNGKPGGPGVHQPAVRWSQHRDI